MGRETVDSQQVYQQIVAPAVLIPACGLLMMSSTARLNTVLGRIRIFHAERLAVWQSEPKPSTPAASIRELRLEGLEFQSHKLLRRASILRTTMLLLLLAVACNLLSAIGLIAEHLAGGLPVPLDSISSLAFGSGVLFMLAAVVTSVFEIWRILETVRYEHERVEALCRPGTAGGGALGVPSGGGVRDPVNE